MIASGEVGCGQVAAHLLRSVACSVEAAGECSSRGAHDTPHLKAILHNTNGLSYISQSNVWRNRKHLFCCGDTGDVSVTRLWMNESNSTSGMLPLDAPSLVVEDTSTGGVST